MNDWQKGVYADLEELDKRVEKLNNFIESSKKINKSAMYWKERCRIAEEYIHECPCDPDITESQKKAYLKWKQATKTPEQSVWLSDD